MIGIVGGTFDPVHNGHLYPVDRLTAALSLPEVRYVLSARPPHRPQPQAAPADRFRMLQLALQDYPRFTADDQEMHRPGPSFTLWTIRNLRQRYARDTLCLILGLDAYLGMSTWHRWQDIMALTNIVVMARPGWSRRGMADQDGDRHTLYSRRSGVVLFAESIEVPLSATDIRARLRHGDDASNALPAAVLDYIRRNQIYGVRCQ